MSGVDRTHAYRPAHKGHEVNTPDVCGCGCDGVPVYRCEGFDYDPRKAGLRGATFVEYCCHLSAEYLAESSAELGFPFTRTRIERPAAPEGDSE